MKKLLLLSMLFLAACSQLFGTATPTPAPTATPAPPTATPVPPTATIAVATATRPVPPVSPTPLSTPSPPVGFDINAADARLAVTYYPPIVQPAPAVLLIHMLGGSKDDWKAFAGNLQKQGYAAMAMDLRGHGGSTGPVDWTKAQSDVETVLKALTARPEVDRNRVGLAGASIGSNLALMVGAADSNIKAVVAFSPGEDYQGLKPGDTITGFGDRPLLLVASKEDTYSTEAVTKLMARVELINAKSQLYTNAGHGMAMFAGTDLETLATNWLNETVRDLK